MKQINEKIRLLLELRPPEKTKKGTKTNEDSKMDGLGIRNQKVFKSTDQDVRLQGRVSLGSE